MLAAASRLAGGLKAPLAHRSSSFALHAVVFSVVCPSHGAQSASMSMLSECAALDHTELRRRVRHELRASTKPGPRRVQRVLNVLEDMRLLGVPPQDADYRTVLPLLVYENQLEAVDAVYTDMMMNGVIPDQVTIRSLLEAYSRAGHTGRVLELMTLVRSLNLEGSNMEELMTFAKVLFGQWMIGHFEQSFAVQAGLRDQGAPVADIMHTALVELHGRHMKHHRQRRDVLTALAEHLLPNPAATDSELLVLFDYCAEQVEVPVLRRLLESPRLLALLGDTRVEAGASCLARALAAPGTWRAVDLNAMFEQLTSLLQVLADMEAAPAADTVEDVMWACHALHHHANALHLALGLADAGHTVHQWQQLPDILVGIVARGWGAEAAKPLLGGQAPLVPDLADKTGVDLARALATALAPPLRLELVLGQVEARLGEGGAHTAAATAALLESLSDSDSEGEGGDQDVEDMDFSSDEE